MGEEKKREIEICVGNYGSYNAGFLVDEWIGLPLAEDELDRRLAGIRRRAEECVNGGRDRRRCDWWETCEEMYVSDYDGVPFGMGDLFGECSDIRELNVLAWMMSDSPDACEKVAGAASCGIDGPDSILELCNWIEQADELPCYSYDLPYDWSEGVVAAMSAEEKFGYMVACQSGLYGRLEDAGIDGYFDFERYGADMSQDCMLGDDCWVDCCQDMPDGDSYDWEDLEAAHLSK